MLASVAWTKNLSSTWQPVTNPNDACTFMLWQPARLRSEDGGASSASLRSVPGYARLLPDVSSSALHAFLGMSHALGFTSKTVSKLQSSVRQKPHR